MDNLFDWYGGEGALLIQPTSLCTVTQAQLHYTLNAATSAPVWTRVPTGATSGVVKSSAIPQGGKLTVTMPPCRMRLRTSSTTSGTTPSCTMQVTENKGPNG